MHFRLPLQVGIFVHLVGPDGRVQLEATGDGDDFLAVGHAVRADNARNGDAFGLAHVFFGEVRTAVLANRRRHSEGRVVCVPKNLIVGRTAVAGRLRSFAIAQDDIRWGGRRSGACRQCCGGRGRFFAALWANVNVFAEGNLEGFEDAFFVKAEALAVGYVPDVGAELSISPQKIADGGQQLFDVIVLLDELSHVTGGARRGDIFQRLR